VCCVAGVASVVLGCFVVLSKQTTQKSNQVTYESQTQKTHITNIHHQYISKKQNQPAKHHLQNQSTPNGHQKNLSPKIEPSRLRAEETWKNVSRTCATCEQNP